MAYQQAGAGRQRACAVGGVLLVQGALVWAVVSGLAVKFVPDIETVIKAHNEPIPIPPPPPPKPQPQHTPEHQTITATKPLVPEPHPVDPMPLNPTPLDPGPFGAPSPGPTLAPTPIPSPTPSFAPLGVRAIGDPSRWLTDEDYPASELRAAHEGAARFRLDVGADGRVTGCTIVGSTGFPALDAATCRIVSHRARFAPARDGSGATVSGSYTGGVRWVIPRD